jgi:hypothetical protein
MVDNSNIPFNYFSLQVQYVKCTAKHIKNELYVPKEKIQNNFWKNRAYKYLAVLADPFTKGLPPSVLRKHTVDMCFMVEPMISGLLRAQVKILFKMDKCIVAG